MSVERPTSARTIAQAFRKESEKRRSAKGLRPQLSGRSVTRYYEDSYTPGQQTFLSAESEKITTKGLSGRDVRRGYVFYEGKVMSRSQAERMIAERARSLKPAEAALYDVKATASQYAQAEKELPRKVVEARVRKYISPKDIQEAGTLISAGQAVQKLSYKKRKVIYPTQATTTTLIQKQEPIKKTSSGAVVLADTNRGTLDRLRESVVRTEERARSEQGINAFLLGGKAIALGAAERVVSIPGQVKEFPGQVVRTVRNPAGAYRSFGESLGGLGDQLMQEPGRATGGVLVDVALFKGAGKAAESIGNAKPAISLRRGEMQTVKVEGLTREQTLFDVDIYLGKGKKPKFSGRATTTSKVIPAEREGIAEVFGTRARLELTKTGGKYVGSPQDEVFRLVPKKGPKVISTSSLSAEGFTTPQGRLFSAGKEVVSVGRRAPKVRSVGYYAQGESISGELGQATRQVGVGFTIKETKAGLRVRGASITKQNALLLAEQEVQGGGVQKLFLVKGGDITGRRAVDKVLNPQMSYPVRALQQAREGDRVRRLPLAQSKKGSLLYGSESGQVASLDVQVGRFDLEGLANRLVKDYQVSRAGRRGSIARSGSLSGIGIEGRFKGEFDIFNPTKSKLSGDVGTSNIQKRMIRQNNSVRNLLGQDFSQSGRQTQIQRQAQTQSQKSLQRQMFAIPARPLTTPVPITPPSTPPPFITGGLPFMSGKIGRAKKRVYGYEEVRFKIGGFKL